MISTEFKEHFFYYLVQRRANRFQVLQLLSKSTSMDTSQQPTLAHLLMIHCGRCLTKGQKTDYGDFPPSKIHSLLQKANPNNRIHMPCLCTLYTSCNIVQFETVLKIAITNMHHNWRLHDIFTLPLKHTCLHVTQRTCTMFIIIVP